MYDELQEVWKHEVENAELQRLELGFYSKAADYLRRLREEGRMLDKRTVKSRLLEKEAHNVQKMVFELVRIRCKKSVKRASTSEGIPSDLLTEEERRIFKGLLPVSEACEDLAKNILRGQVPMETTSQEHNRIPLRFLKTVPGIIGADMKNYGPFESEDVASVPTENAKILVRQGLAEEIAAA